MSLNKNELETLAGLLRRIDNTQITGPVWHALVKKFPTVAVELIILDEDNNVFLVYRKDEEFCGWHHPGSVWNDWETIDQRLERLIEREITEDAQMKISKPYPIGWRIEYKDIPKNNKVTRSTCSLYYVAKKEGEFVKKAGYDFFPFDQLPEDTLPFHKEGLAEIFPHLFSEITLAGTK